MAGKNIPGGEKACSDWRAIIGNVDSNFAIETMLKSGMQTHSVQNLSRLLQGLEDAYDFMDSSQEIQEASYVSQSPLIVDPYAAIPLCKISSQIFQIFDKLS